MVIDCLRFEPLHHNMYEFEMLMESFCIEVRELFRAFAREILGGWLTGPHPTQTHIGLTIHAFLFPML